jgi:hypothetical protein
MCTELAKKLGNAPSPRQADKIKRKLFELVASYVSIWIKSALRNNKSLDINTWECFLFCIDRYDPSRGINILGHLHAYTKFFVMAEASKNAKHDACITIDGCVIATDGDTGIADVLGDLGRFRACLPEEYKPVWDDAVMSMVGCHRDRTRKVGNTTLNYNQYCEGKRLLKIMVDFLLRGGSILM